MIVISIDPGIANVGIAVLQVGISSTPSLTDKPSLITSVTLRTKSNKHILTRLHELATEFQQIIYHYQLANVVVAIEENSGSIFYSTGKTLRRDSNIPLAIGCLLGVVFRTLPSAHVYFLPSSRQKKESWRYLLEITEADKQSVKRWVLDNVIIPPDCVKLTQHSYDAIAIGVAGCKHHIQSRHHIQE